MNLTRSCVLSLAIAACSCKSPPPAEPARPIIINQCAPVTLCPAPAINLATNESLERSLRELSTALFHCASQVRMVFDCQQSTLIEPPAGGRSEAK